MEARIVAAAENGTSNETPVGRWVFDTAVVVALASAAYHLFAQQGEPGVRFLLLAFVMLVTRWGNVPAPFAAAFASFMLVAAWASVEHWYRDITWADEVVHFVTPGSLAAAAYFFLANCASCPMRTSHVTGCGPGHRCSG